MERRPSGDIAAPLRARESVGLGPFLGPGANGFDPARPWLAGIGFNGVGKRPKVHRSRQGVRRGRDRKDIPGLVQSHCQAQRGEEGSRLIFWLGL